MKRAALLSLFFSVAPAVLFAGDLPRRMIVGTRVPALNALQRLRSDDFDPGNRVRYAVVAFEYVNAFAADLTESEIAAMKRSPVVEYVEEDLERHAFADSIIAGQQTTPYGVSLVQAPQAWLTTRGQSFDSSKPIHVTIIDSGIDYNAPEIAGAYRGGLDVVNGDNDPYDDAGHGTHVAGIIAAADNGSGVVGVAPQADIFSVKVLDSCGSGSTTGIITALDWVRDQKKKIGGNWILNLSLGAPGSRASERTAFQGAADDGILAFAASGNDFPNTTGLSFPAGYPTVESVGAIDDTRTVANFSQRGTGLKLVAPGVSNLSTFIGEQVATNDGRKFHALLAGALNTDGTANDRVCIPKPVASGTFVFCGRGNPADIPAAVNGKIALIERGDLTFLVKAQNAKAAGATAIIFYDNGPPSPTFGGPGYAVTNDAPPDVPPTVMLTQADGQSLKATPNATVSVGFDDHGFALLSGTSMACPHAVGVAVLAWSVAPSLKNTDIASAMEQTAVDLGDAGVDNAYGFGLVNAKAVVDLLNTGNPIQPPPPTGRNPGRRGH
jgi:subtilisin family serine protease